jgi:hypothetical protein
MHLANLVKSVTLYIAYARFTPRYSPLGSPGSLSEKQPDMPKTIEDETVVAIAKKLNKGPAEVRNLL